MSSANTRVLIADDDAMIRMIIAEALGDDGFDILEACDGEEACRLLDDPDGISLVVTDLNMPGSDGIEVAKCARAHHPEVLVLFVSGRPDLLVDLPFPYRYLAKPFKLDTLSAAVREPGKQQRERRSTPISPAIMPLVTTGEQFKACSG